jgi:Leucine-rich repeat (LRR) protein
MGLSGSKKNDFSNPVGPNAAAPGMPPAEQELEIDEDMQMLDLRMKRLDKLPWDLSVLSNLTELDLSMNAYSQIPDQCMWRGGHLATSLTKLSINQNQIQKISEGRTLLYVIRWSCSHFLVQMSEK